MEEGERKRQCAGRPGSGDLQDAPDRRRVNAVHGVEAVAEESDAGPKQDYVVVEAVWSERVSGSRSLQVGKNPGKTASGTLRWTENRRDASDLAQDFPEQRNREF